MSWLKKIKRDAISSRLLDEQIYAQVLSEVENGQRRDGLWAKALAHSDGSNEKAKSLYIKYRADSIRDEIALAAKYEEEKAKNHAQKDNSALIFAFWIHILVWLLFFLLFLPFLLAWLGFIE